jgi:hypothetical protein
MESKLYRVLIISNAVGVAAYSAITLGYVALYYFGFPSEQVRGGAMLAAILNSGAGCRRFIWQEAAQGQID